MDTNTELLTPLLADGNIVYDAGNNQLFAVDASHTANSGEDAVLAAAICAACNSHAPYLAALQAIRDEFGDKPSTLAITRRIREIVDAALPTPKEA